MIVLMLQRGGHEAAPAYSGEAAHARMTHDAFDVVVSDLRMGTGLDGWGLARWVRRFRPAVWFILRTAEAGWIDPIAARERGAAAVLGKPVGIADMLGAVEAARGIAA